MVHYCCVYGCKSKWSSGCNIKFHSFPSKKDLAAKWLIAIRSGKKPSKYTKVCSKHFKKEDYVETETPGFYILNSDAVPSENIPHRSFEREKREKDDRSKRVARRNKAQSHTVYNTTTSDDVSSDQGGDDLRYSNEHDPEDSSEEVIQVPQIFYQGNNDFTECGAFGEIPAAQEEVPQASESQGPAQNDNASSSYSSKCTDQETQTELPCSTDATLLSISDITEGQLKYFTGLTSERFCALYSFCMKNDPAVPSCRLNGKDQLLLVLCKYKLNLDYILIGTLFKVDRRMASNLLIFWTNQMYFNFKTVDWWSMRLQGDDLYTVIIDCTEIPTAKSSNPEYHQQMFSNYKNRPTLKGLVGIDEAGNVIFCSDLYGGSTSDKQMVNLSKFLNKLQKGDIVLADRGFDISDLLESKGVALNIPPFKRSRNQLTEKEIMSTRFIAQRRIHIERLIGFAKVHQILVDILPDHFWPIASKFFFNCMMLCNFKKGIVTSW